MNSKNASWLDTSALLAVLLGEPGADEVQRLLAEAKQNRLQLFLSAISLTEIANCLARSQGAEVARADTRLIVEMPLSVTSPTPEQCITAGLLRAQARISTADAIIATQAMEANTALVHKDPEFDAVPGLQHRRLPYKRKKR